jgi:hypothetical protein
MIHGSRQSLKPKPDGCEFENPFDHRWTVAESINFRTSISKFDWVNTCFRDFAREIYGKFVATRKKIFAEDKSMSFCLISLTSCTKLSESLHRGREKEA